MSVVSGLSVPARTAWSQTRTSQCLELALARKRYAVGGVFKEHRRANSSTTTVTFPLGQRSSFSNVWLRDHSRDPSSYHPATKQRLVDTAAIDPAIAPLATATSDRGLTATWPDGVESFYPFAFLLEHAYDPPLAPPLAFTRDKSRSKVFWTRDIARELPTVAYQDVMASEKGVWRWLRLLDIYGFSLIKGLPATGKDTEALLRRIAFVRPTHYDHSGFWEFEANLEHGDLAYSNAELRAHTDTTYFTDPCGLQLFHLLSPLSSHQGGHNLLVDGFRAAAILREMRPDLYELLSAVPVPAHASGSGTSSLPSGVHIRPRLQSPVFTHDPDSRELVTVRWNPEDRDVIGGHGWDRAKMSMWYDAVRAWEAILRSNEAQLWTRMEPGTAVIFDNHRVLHGRSAFTGKRRLCGAYIAGDDYRSRLTGLDKMFAPESGRPTTLNEFGIETLGRAEEDQRAWEGYL